MRTTTVGVWSSHVDYWNRQSPAQRRQIAEECKREGHEWARNSVVVYCMKCLKIILDDEKAA